MSKMFLPLRRYADFQGRSDRSEYWLFVLLQAGVSLVVVLLITVFIGVTRFGESPARDSIGFVAIPIAQLGLLVFILYTFIPSLAVTVRRLHDTNRSGWWILIRLVPILGELVFIVFLLLKGTAGPNRFGTVAAEVSGQSDNGGLVGPVS